MELTKDEKDVLIYLVKRDLDEIRKNENLQNQTPVDLSTEVRYDMFLSRLLAKLKKA